MFANYLVAIVFTFEECLKSEKVDLKFKLQIF